MNSRVVQFWHSFAIGLFRAALLFRERGYRSEMRECALEAIAFQRSVDPTVFRYQSTFDGIFVAHPSPTEGVATCAERVGSGREGSARRSASNGRVICRASGVTEEGERASGASFAGSRFGNEQARAHDSASPVAAPKPCRGLSGARLVTRSQFSPISNGVHSVRTASGSRPGVENFTKA